MGDAYKALLSVIKPFFKFLVKYSLTFYSLYPDIRYSRLLKSCPSSSSLIL
jgi:hypothetical protein